MKIKIYTDGACSGNPGKGGWAAIIIDGNKNQTGISGSEKNTTNNRMELMAPIMALKKIEKKLRRFKEIKGCILFNFNKLTHI